MKNQEVAAVFDGIADILEIQGANPFRIRAYLKAAQNIENLTEDISVVAELEADLKKIEEEIADMPSAVTRKIDVRGSA